jgi:peroxiredoxin
LRRWEELRPELDRRGVQIVTVSSETPGKIRAGRAKHGLQAVMLADADASVIEALGIRNRGVHSGPPGGAPLPIPTTVLADAQGIVRWIDQSESYQQRSDPARVRAALEAHLG